MGRGDYSQAEFFDPDVEWVQGVTHDLEERGIDSLGRFWADVLSAYEGLRTIAEEILELEDDRVLVLARFAGTGRGSGVPLQDLRSTVLFAFRNGTVVKVTLWPNRETALAELGLKR